MQWPLEFQVGRTCKGLKVTLVADRAGVDRDEHVARPHAEVPAGGIGGNCRDDPGRTGERQPGVPHEIQQHLERVEVHGRKFISSFATCIGCNGIVRMSGNGVPGGIRKFISSFSTRIGAIGIVQIRSVWSIRTALFLSCPW